MNRLSVIPLAALVCASLASGLVAPSAEANPFFQAWNTPFGVPPFEQIKNEHFLPALKKGIEEERREVVAIAKNPQAASFSNTIEALDRAGELLEKVQSVFSNLTSAETNDRLQEIQKEVAPLLAGLRDDILLDPQLFARVKAVWEQRGKLKLNAEQLRLLEETHKDFVRGGANLGPEEKRRLRAINEELAVLGLSLIHISEPTRPY